MSEIVERAIALMRELPPDRREELAQIILFHVEHPPLPLTAEEEADIAESLAQADRGEFATDEEVQAVWAKFGL